MKNFIQVATPLKVPSIVNFIKLSDGMSSDILIIRLFYQFYLIKIFNRWQLASKTLSVSLNPFSL